MTEKEIKSEINEKLNQGTSKSVLYEQFKDEINVESLRKFLAARPSFEQRLKFKKAHVFLSIIWGIFILLELLGIFDLVVSFDIKILFSLCVSIYIAFHIWNFDGRYFLPGIVWFVFTIINSFRELSSFNEYDAIDYGTIIIITCIYSLILVVGIFLMYYIKKNVFSYFKWFQPLLNQDHEIQFEK